MLLESEGLCGWINIDKPEGMSSNRVNSIVKRLIRACGRVKVGYAGTLDPIATGVLPIAIGRATRLISHLVDCQKEYLTTIQWGEERDTDDREGQVTRQSGANPTEESVLKALSCFAGDIMQVPPQFSALKVRGKRVCDRVRRGEEIVLSARPVRIDRIDLVGHSDTLRQTTLRVSCGKGVYIRSLARDLGRELGTYGHVFSLRRERVGPFRSSEGITLAKLQTMEHSIGCCVTPPESALDDILATFAVRGPFQKGQNLGSSLGQEDECVRIFCDTAFVGLAQRRDSQLWCVWRR